MTEHNNITNNSNSSTDKENTVIKTGYYNLKDGIKTSEDGPYAISKEGNAALSGFGSFLSEKTLGEHLPAPGGTKTHFIKALFGSAWSNVASKEIEMIVNDEGAVKFGAADAFNIYTEATLAAAALAALPAATTVFGATVASVAAGTIVSYTFSTFKDVSVGTMEYIIDGAINPNKADELKFYDKNGEHVSGMLFPEGMPGHPQEHRNAVLAFLAKEKGEAINGGTAEIVTSLVDTQLDASFTIYNGNSFTERIVALSNAENIDDWLLTGDRKNLNSHAFKDTGDFYFFEDNEVALDMPVIINGKEEIITISRIYSDEVSESNLELGEHGFEIFDTYSLVIPSDLSKGAKLKSGSGEELMIGTEYDDELDAGGDNDIILGKGGNDKIRASNGDDIIDGGKGKKDLIDYTPFDAAIKNDIDVDLSKNEAVIADFATSKKDKLYNIENVRTGGGDDNVIGDDKDNTFNLGEGKNTADGKEGSDTIQVFNTDKNEDVKVDLMKGYAALEEKTGETQPIIGDWVKREATVDTISTTFTNIENAEVSGGAVNYISGTPGPNTFFIKGGDMNLLYGGGGADTYKFELNPDKATVDGWFGQQIQTFDMIVTFDSIDKLDFSDPSMSHIGSIGDIVIEDMPSDITGGDTMLHLGSGHKVGLLGYGVDQLNKDNFIFEPLPEAEEEIQSGDAGQSVGESGFSGEVESPEASVTPPASEAPTTPEPAPEVQDAPGSSGLTPEQEARERVEDAVDAIGDIIKTMQDIAVFFDDIGKQIDDFFSGISGLFEAEVSPVSVEDKSSEIIPTAEAYTGIDPPVSEKPNIVESAIDEMAANTSPDGAGIASGYSAGYMALHIAKAVHENGVLHDDYGSLYDADSVVDHSQVREFIKNKITRNLLLNPEAKQKVELLLEKKAKEIEQDEKYQDKKDADLLAEVNKAERKLYRNMVGSREPPTDSELLKYALKHPASSIKNLATNFASNFKIPNNKPESKKETANDTQPAHESSGNNGYAASDQLTTATKPDSPKNIDFTDKNTKGYISTTEMLRQDTVNLTYTLAKLTNLKPLKSWSQKQIQKRYEAEQQKTEARGR